MTSKVVMGQLASNLEMETKAAIGEFDHILPSFQWLDP